MNAREIYCECHDTGEEHEAWQRAELAYWAHYFGQDYGTKVERQARLKAMDPRNEENKETNT